MEPFKNMKGKLREENPLPEGFGWEDMQEGIFEKMADLTAPEKEKKRFEYWKLTLFSLGMVVMLGLGSLCYLERSEQQMIDGRQELTKPLASANQVNKSFKNRGNLTGKEQLNPKERATQALTTIENHPTNLINDKERHVLNRQPKSTADLKIDNKIEVKEVVKFSQNSARKGIAIDQENNLRNNNPNSKVSANLVGTKISKHDNILPTTEKKERSSETTSFTTFNNYLSTVKTVGSIINIKNDNPIWTLQALEKKPFEILNYQRLSTINPLSLSNPLAVEKRENNTRFSMAIGLGLNYWTPNWGSSSTSQERAQYEKALVGNTYSLLFDYRLYPKWSLGTGIMNSTYFSQFNYKETEVYQAVKEEVLVEIQVNTFTGDSTKIYDDSVININRERQVVHYNTFKKWSVPLIVKYSLSNKKVEYAFGIGTMLTLSTKTAGKTINSTIQDYNANSPIYQTGTEIGALGTFDLNYHLSEKYYIGAQLSGIASLKNWSIEEEVDLKPLIFNSQLTIGMKF